MGTTEEQRTDGVIAIVDIDKQHFRVFADGRIEQYGKPGEAVKLETQVAVYRSVVAEMAKTESGATFAWRGSNDVSVRVARGGHAH